jgi:hypothetical protein
MVWYFVYPDVINGKTRDYDFYESSPCWTKNPVHAIKFIEEYKLVGFGYKVDEIECSTFDDFVAYVEKRYNTEINQYNEINVTFSQVRPELYHASTWSIDDDYVTGGLRDSQSQFIEQAICRSIINMIKLSNYMKPSGMKEGFMKVLNDYVQPFVLMNNTDMASFNSDFDNNILDKLGVDNRDRNDGVFSIIDMVAYERLCAGVPL